MTTSTNEMEIQMKNDLSAQAEALKAINTAKHKAKGATHRIEVRIHGKRGYKETKVIYINEAEATPVQFAVYTAHKNKSTCLSDFLIEAI